jgi:hypothetical protein
MESAGIAATGWLISLLVRRHMGSWLIGVLTALTYVTFASTRHTIERGNFTEQWGAPFVVLCLYAALRAARGGGWFWPIVSGFGLGMAICLRPPSILIGGVLLLLVPSLWRAGRFTVATVLGWFVGFAIVPAAVCVWAASQGVLGLMLSLCLGFNFSYATQQPSLPAWTGAWRTVLSLVVSTWLWHLIGAMGLAEVVFKWVEQQNREPGRRGGIPIKGIAVVWLLTAVASALLTRWLWIHYYYLVLAPVAFLSAWAWQSLARFCQRLEAWRSAFLFWLVSAAIFAGMGYQVVMDYGGASQCRRDAACIGEAVAFLAEHGKPTDTLYIFPWGIEIEISARLGWRCPSRHAYVGHYPPLPGSLAPGGLMEQWRDDMLRSPPDWLVCSAYDDLMAGLVRDLDGWGVLTRAKEIGGEVSDAYQGFYVERARFSSGGPKDYPYNTVIIYQRK